MGLKDCIIKLDNPWNTYYPGQTINGAAEYTFDSPKKVRGISVKVKGVCFTKIVEYINETRDGKTTRVQVDHTGDEEYFSITYYILGNKSGNEIEIPPGTHTYPFTCVLPPTLPSSFEGTHGHVRYTVKVTLDRPWKFDQDTKMAFTVVSHVDLNLNPQYNMPIHLHREKTFCCFCCASGPLIVDCKIPVSGFCSGQYLPADISVENGSNVKITDVQLKLIKTVKYRTKKPSSKTNTEEVLIVEAKLGEVLKNSSEQWKEFLQIPPLPPSSLANCSLIDLDYKIMIECVSGGAHSNVASEQIITIGTIPLVGFNPMPPPVNEDGTQIMTEETGQPLLLEPTAPVIPMSPEETMNIEQQSQQSQHPMLNAYPQMGPPIFQEGQFSTHSIHDAEDNSNTRGRVDFTPRYPMYGFVVPPKQ